MSCTSPTNTDAGKDSDAGHDDCTCNGASACVPTCALVDSTPRFTLLPSSRRHVHPHENPTSSGQGGVVEANGTLISKNTMTPYPVLPTPYFAVP